MSPGRLVYIMMLYTPSAGWFQGSDGLVLGASIRVNGKVTSHQRVSSHLLVLDHIDSGPVEIAVTFSSEVCNKTTVTNYTSKMLHVYDFHSIPFYS